MSRVKNLQFSFRRFRFNVRLALDRHALVFFRRLLKGSVAAAILAAFSLWVLGTPGSVRRAADEAVTTLPDVPLRVITEPPFTDLREPAQRPVPVPVISAPLELVP